MNNSQALKKGYTTGSCAAAAAACAVRVLLFPGLSDPEKMLINLPRGQELELPVHHVKRGAGWVCCAIQKDSGDDPDVTHGVMVYAAASKLENRPGEVVIKGGEGIGTVTKPGLDCPVGDKAINSVPRQMIRQQVDREANSAGYGGGLLIEISIPEGVEIAKKTFNPKLGIKGGLSVLGTTGIVEPMSRQALIDTIKVEINMKKAMGMDYLILTPGSFGQTFLREYLGDAEEHTVKCSNFIGDSLDHCSQTGLHGVVLAGHIGKLVKVAAGVMNTHSQHGDRRMKTLAAYTKKQEQGERAAASVLECVTTEEALVVLKEDNLADAVVQSLLQDVARHMRERTKGVLQTEVILYANQHGFLGQTEGTGKLIEAMTGEKEWEHYTE